MSMRAEQAAEVFEKADVLHEALVTFDSKVRIAAREGERHTWVDFFGKTGRHREAVMAHLRTLGYRVRRRWPPLRWVLDGIKVSW